MWNFIRLKFEIPCRQKWNNFQVLFKIAALNQRSIKASRDNKKDRIDLLIIVSLGIWSFSGLISIYVFNSHDNDRDLCFFSNMLHRFDKLTGNRDKRERERVEILI